MCDISGALLTWRIQYSVLSTLKKYTQAEYKESARYTVSSLLYLKH